MRLRGKQFGVTPLLRMLPLAASLALVGAPGALAQRRIVVQQRVRPRTAPRIETPPANRAMETPRPVAPAAELPRGWMGRLQAMTPAQQEKFFKNNARFRSLAPEQQEQVRQNLQAWNNLSPEQKQALVDRQRVWEQMSPEQQRYVKQTLLPEWQSIPQGRQDVLMQKLHDLRGLDDGQRAEKLNDDQFLNGLSPDERQMLRDLSNLRISGPEPPE